LTRGAEGVQIGPIVLYGLRTAADRSAERFTTKAGLGFPVKTGTEVAADTRVTLSVAVGDRGHLALLYGDFPAMTADGLYRMSNAVAAVRFEACPADEPRFSGPGVVGRRTKFNGGFAVSAPGCYELQVRVAGQERVLRRMVSFGAGAKCGARR
jgi:hypothetical protein